MFPAEQIIREFKSLSVNTELSYETRIHKKVYDSNHVSAIPEGKKAFAWFTQYKKQNVCFLLEMFGKEITQVKTIFTAFHEKIAYGSIFYGTTFYYDHNPFFCVEDVLQYKSKTIPRATPGAEKIKIYKEMFSMTYLKQETCMKNQWIFGLPLMSKTIDDLMKQLNCVPYKIKCVQFHYPEKKCVLEYTELQQMIHGANQFNHYNNYNNQAKNTGDRSQQPQFKNIDPNKEVVFRLTADVQNDIYNLFVYNPQLEKENEKFEFVDVAYIPDYKTSVFMNGYFRKIKENKNLDALEESDDEEEFQDDRPDKFVYLDKKYNMVCKYNNKFRRWAPCSLAGKNERVITKMELNQLNRDGEQYYLQKRKYSQNVQNNYGGQNRNENTQYQYKKYPPAQHSRNYQNPRNFQNEYPQKKPYYNKKILV